MIIPPKVYDRGEWQFTIGDQIIAENRRQRVYLEPKHHYFRKHYLFVRALIELGEIKDYDSLLHYCQGRINIYYTAQQPQKQMEYK